MRTYLKVKGNTMNMIDFESTHSVVMESRDTVRLLCELRETATSPGQLHMFNKLIGDSQIHRKIRIVFDGSGISSRIVYGINLSGTSSPLDSNRLVPRVMHMQHGIKTRVNYRWGFEPPLAELTRVIDDMFRMTDGIVLQLDVRAVEAEITAKGKVILHRSRDI